ncbi:hypothetical protein AB4Z52_12535 [Rhizobium sp. 2YAF20]|uniref:hypothetical protein n=1 Tax=Rhizobium sp. 2YAF20 TaxID=3233027 RepID=UPI003F9D16CE
MASSEWEKLGLALRQALAGFLDVSKQGSYFQDDNSSIESYGEQLPDPDSIVAACNQATTLKPGSLLVTYQYDNSCYQVTPETSEIEFLFTVKHRRKPFLWRVVASTSGKIYCSLGGTRVAHGPFEYAIMDKWGAIVSIDLRTGKVSTIAKGERLLMPSGIELYDSEARLLVCATNDFESPGAIYWFDLTTAEQDFLAVGAPLVDPVTAILDKKGTLWICNSDQTKQDGELLAVRPNGHCETMLKRRGPGSGGICGVCHTEDNSELILFRMDWPKMRHCAVTRFNTKSRKESVILESVPGTPRFFSTCGVVRDGILWFGESYRKVIYGYDLLKSEITSEIDFSSVMGGSSIGMKNSYYSIENISVVPKFKGCD